MRPNIVRLRNAYSEYMSAKQARYDELALWDAYDADAFEKHKVIAGRIKLEESSPIKLKDEIVYVSIYSYICDDKLFLCHFHNDGVLSPSGETRWDEEKFDLA